MASRGRLVTPALVGLLVGMLGAVLGGCTGSGDAGPAASPTTAATVSPSPAGATSTASATPAEATGSAIPDGPDGLVVLDSGDEPRTQLSASVPLDDRVAVTASSSSTLDLDGEVDEATTTAEYRLDVVLEPADGTSLLVATTVDLTTDAVPEVPPTLGRFEWTLAPSGRVVDMAAVDWAEPIAPELRRLLSFSHLVLEVPTIPVGAGARWQRDVDGAEVIVTLHEVDDEAVHASVEVRSAPSGGELAVTSEATWERDTLVALDVATTSTATAVREVVADGVPTTARVEQVDERHLVRDAGSWAGVPAGDDWRSCPCWAPSPWWRSRARRRHGRARRRRPARRARMASATSGTRSGARSSTRSCPTGWTTPGVRRRPVTCGTAAWSRTSSRARPGVPVATRRPVPARPGATRTW